MSPSPKIRKNIQLIGTFHDMLIVANRELSPFGMVFVYEPENIEQRELGTIFGIIKISETSKESSFITNFLASVIRKEFFSRTDRSAEASFEAALRKANFALSELARQGSVKWMGKINFIGGVLEKNNLHFSKIGSTYILLLRAGMIADIGSGINESAEDESHPLKTFSDISSGKVEEGDCLIFTTSDLLEIFSFDEIRQNAARFSRSEFPEILSASLKANSELSGTIVLNVSREKELIPIPDKAKKGTVEVPQPLDRTFMAPPPRRERVFPMSSPPAKVPPRPPVTPQKSDRNKIYISESDQILPKKSVSQKAGQFFQTSSTFSKQVAVNMTKKGFYFFRKIDWERISNLLKLFFASAARSLRRIDLKKKNTRILAAAGIVLILAIAAFSYYPVFKKGASPVTNEVPSDPISVPPAELEDVNVAKIDGISDVTALHADSHELVILDETIYTLTGGQSIIRINPTTGETEKADSDLSGGKFLLAAGMPDLDLIFILTADKKLLSFSPLTKQFQENGISLPEDLKAAALKTYLTYIYLLDASAGQIYRFPRAEGGFGDRQSWLKSGEEVKSASDFGINDDLFVASRDQIIAYYQGKRDEKVSFESPRAPLAVDKIFTAPDFANIYALDNKNHRIVVFGKDGRIIKQYWSADLSGIKDFTVDEKNNLIYILRSTSLSKFPMK